MTNLIRFKGHRLCLILILLLSTVGCDQVTKVIARDTLSRPTSYLGDFLRLQHAENPGAFLSIGAGFSDDTRFWMFTIGVAVFLLIAFWILLTKSTMDKWITVSLTLIVAGGIGNLIDRASRGTVTDFMNLGIGWLRTGVFNVADVAITFGIGILFVVTTRPTRFMGDH